LTFLHFTLIIINIFSFIRGSKTQQAVNNEEFFCGCVAILYKKDALFEMGDIFHKNAAELTAVVTI